jgi:hypothetical protein
VPHASAKENRAFTLMTEDKIQKPPSIRSRGPSLLDKNSPQTSCPLNEPFAKDKSLLASVSKMFV